MGSGNPLQRNVEDQNGVRRDHPSGTSGPVSQLRRKDKPGFVAHPE